MATKRKKHPKVGDQVEVMSSLLNIPWTRTMVREVEEHGFRVIIGSSHGGIPWDSDEWRWPEEKT